MKVKMLPLSPLPPWLKKMNVLPIFFIKKQDHGLISLPLFCYPYAFYWRKPRAVMAELVDAQR
ncbi:MAG: hypothetical protein PHW63_01945 [Alphaproteobacteria bacterium]|nr:hypothetical protein [Alphaproteobacteria bacterium]